METIHYNQSTNPVNHVVMGYGHFFGQEKKIGCFPFWPQFW